MLETKKSKVIAALKRGDDKTALRIASKFNIEFNKNEQRIISIAYECMSGHESFYKQLNIDTWFMIVESINILKNKYLTD